MTNLTGKTIKYNGKEFLVISHRMGRKYSIIEMADGNKNIYTLKMIPSRLGTIEVVEKKEAETKQGEELRDKLSTIKNHNQMIREKKKDIKVTKWHEILKRDCPGLTAIDIMKNYVAEVRTNQGKKTFAIHGITETGIKTIVPQSALTSEIDRVLYGKNRRQYQNIKSTCIIGLVKKAVVK